MNTLGANLASVRSGPESPASRSGRDDDSAVAFGAMLGALAGDGAPGAKPAPAELEPETPPPPPTDAAPASTLLKALDAATSVPTGGIPGGIENLLGQTAQLTLIAPPSVASTAAMRRGGPAAGIAMAGLHERLQVTVLSQETHFAPVKPHPVTLMPVLPAAAEDVGAANLIGSTQPGQVSAAVRPDTSAVANAATAFDALSPSHLVLAAASIQRASPEPGGPDPAIATVSSSTAANPLSGLAIAPGIPNGVQGTAEADPAQPSGVSPGASTATPAQSSQVDASSAETPAPATGVSGLAKATSPGPSGGKSVTAETSPSNDDTERPMASPASQANAVRSVRPGSLEASPDDRNGRRSEDAKPVIAATVIQGAPASSAPQTLQMPSIPMPSLQVAEAVLAEVGRLPGVSGPVIQSGAEGPLRILTIQLRPDDLGTVVVRMRLRGDQLEMSLHASREETASLLRSDGAALDDLLRSAGYQPDLVTVTSGRGEGAGAADPARGGAAGSSAQGGSNSDPRHANSDQSGRRQPEPRDPERAGISRDRTSDETNSVGSGRLGRYL
ncbi:MAG: flagellar hook-length control protein FliK [Methylobacterium sp.]|uniref:flagellar hook-length control protein FliK n=1 Tax=Methylobacterium sp. TaxID=409 RepID=UPI0025F6F9C0|nr:flagellar hook-length control protein FliK [Methylobacterium sp.]MBX9931917.1 flagellar hook-length control protein FliK [Methylobacterium sp.]